MRHLGILAATPPAAVAPTRTFGQDMRICREKRGFSIRKLAHKLRASDDDVRAWEADRVKMPHNTFTRLCAVMSNMRRWQNHPEALAPTKDEKPEAPLAPVMAAPVAPAPAPPQNHQPTTSPQPTAMLDTTATTPIASPSKPEETVTVTSQATQTDKVETFGQALARIRREEDVYRHIVAGLCKVATKTVARWEKGELQPTKKNYARLIEVFPKLADGPKPQWTGEKSFGRMLSVARSVAGLSQAELGDIVGVHAGTVSNWEIDAQKPSEEALAKLVEYFPALAGSIVNKVAASTASMSFGKALKLARIQADMKTDDVGAKIGVWGSVISHWERDIHVPVLANYEKLLELFPQLRDVPAPKFKEKDVPVGFAGPRPGYGNGRKVKKDDRDKTPPKPAAKAPSPTPTAPHSPVQTGMVDMIAMLTRIRAVESLAGKDAVLGLLRDAVRLGISVADLLKMIAPEG